jgi:hypothetical protein
MNPSAIVDKFINYPLSPTNYFREEFPKKQIYLHHTVSHPNAISNINYWRSLGFRIATSFVIAGTPYPHEKNYKDGDIYVAFPPEFWALHLGTHGAGNRVPAKYKNKDVTRVIEKASIGIEICNAGWLTYENGKFYSSFRSIIPENQVIEYVDKYRGYKYFHAYSDAQIESLRLLLHYLCQTYNIPKTFTEETVTKIFDIYTPALEGEPGIYTHTSVRSDKTDCHPQPELKAMLLGLKDDIITPPEIKTVATKTEIPDPLSEQTYRSVADDMEALKNESALTNG